MDWGSQLAVDTTLVCALRSDGTPLRGAAEADGVVLSRARQRKEQRYPELMGPGSRARLVVLAVEVGGRWSAEMRTFVAQLAKGKVRQEPRLLQKRVEQADALGPLSSCLLDLRCAHGADVEADHRHRMSAGPL